MWRAVSPTDAPGTWPANHAPSRGRSRPGTSLIAVSTRQVPGRGQEAGDERGEHRTRAGGIGVQDRPEAHLARSDQVRLGVVDEARAPRRPADPVEREPVDLDLRLAQPDLAGDHDVV